MHKSFENLWKEYIDYRKDELEKGGIDNDITQISIYELEDKKEDIMDFYAFCKLKEEIL